MLLELREAFSTLFMGTMNQRSGKKTAHIFENGVFRLQCGDEIDEVQKNISALIVQAQPAASRGKCLTWRPSCNGKQLSRLDPQIGAKIFSA